MKPVGHLKPVSFLFFIFFVFIHASISGATDEVLLGEAAEKAGKSREALTHYVAALQTTTDGSVDDQRLREKIIQAVKKLSPPPAVPEEANRRLARGQAAVKIAKDEQGFLRAAEEFRQMVRAAPWLAEGYYNLGLVQDKGGQYADAIRSLKLYLLAAPGANDAKQVQDLIYEIEYRMEDQAKGGSAPAAAAFDPSSLSGQWRVGLKMGDSRKMPERGDEWLFAKSIAEVQIIGSSFHMTIFTPTWQPFEFDGNISGNTITGTAVWIESPDPAQDKFMPCGRIQKARFDGTVNPTEPNIMLTVRGLMGQIAEDCASDSVNSVQSRILLR